MKKLFALIALSSLVACGPKTSPAFKPGEYKLQQLTERVYVLHGANELPNPKNRGFMNNPGFVVTSKGVVVIDPGSSRQVGELLLAKITEVTPQPVVAVFNTHIHGDHWLGNHAVKEKYPRAVIYAHAKMKSAATSGEGPRWVDLINRMTDNAIAGTKPVPPEITVESDETLRVGDRRFRVLHPGKAHTDGDIMIEVVEDKTLFLGDLVIVKRLGRIEDGLVKGNVQAIDIALKTSAVHFVPGHGPSNGRENLVAYRAYLNTLYSEVRKHYDKDPGDPNIKDKVLPALAPYKTWKSFDEEVGRHIGFTVRQVEAELF